MLPPVVPSGPASSDNLGEDPEASVSLYGVSNTRHADKHCICSQLLMGKTQVLKASKAVVLKLFHPLPQIITHIKAAIHVTPKRNQNSVLSQQACLILTVHASSKQSRDPGFENPRPESGPLNPQLLPATLCYVPHGGI